MATTFRLATTSRHPIEALFAVSLSIDAHVLSMSRSRERAVGGVTSGRIGLGQSVTWRARHFGVWFTMTSRIAELDAPFSFVDEQESGPFRSYRHHHQFLSADGVSTMVDTVIVASPFLGRIVERLVLVPRRRRLIRERNAHLLALLDAGEDIE